ncbi:protease complex subunit PrcB family protein [candidate division WOR-3 bacterium]|nr:protease complex subunit PrcB family protein [candidate division WOR-3 bacterium]
MKKKLVIWVAAALILLVACPGKCLKPVGSVTAIKCGSLQYSDAGGMVFRDAKSWEAFWDDHCRAVSLEGENLEAPEVDFSAQMLVGVFSGEKPTGGYGINIQRVLEGSKSLVVEYVEKSPDPDAMVSQVITYPCHIVAIPRSDKTVEFKRTNKD